MKAVIPAAGLGTRFLPIAKAVPKEMLPIGDKPVIHYVVEEAVAAGFEEILIIISKGKESIVEYFGHNPALEAELEKSGKLAVLEAVRRTSRMARIQFCYQPVMRGLGDAVALAREFIGNDPAFAVLLGDTVMQGGSPLTAMLAAWRRLQLPSVCLEPTPEARVQRYGIAGGTELSSGVFELDCLVEKPAPERAPRLVAADGGVLPFHAFAARYLFTPQIFDALVETQAGYAGEIQLTDAMESLRQASRLLGITWSGKRLDIGSPAGLYAAASVLSPREE
jgi:UTP--glucose-1-phosphate uridylyltransferase